MKILLSILLLFSVSKGCTEDKLVQLNYQAAGMISYYKMSVNSENGTKWNSREQTEGKSITIARNDWKEIEQLLKNIDAGKINEMAAPSTKHQYDGAMGAFLEVDYGDKVYRSVTFDHGNPPKELAPIITKMTAVVSSGE